MRAPAAADLREFDRDLGGPLPEVVDDDLRPTPTTTYGTCKAVVEPLLTGLGRRGKIDACALRLPFVVTRHGAPRPTASDRFAALTREPLAGADVEVPFDFGTLLALASAGAVMGASLSLPTLPADALPPSPAFNLSAITASAANLMAAVRRRGACGHFRAACEPESQRVVDGWPGRSASSAARRSGIAGDRDLEAIVDDHLAHLEDLDDVSPR